MDKKLIPEDPRPSYQETAEKKPEPTKNKNKKIAKLEDESTIIIHKDPTGGNNDAFERSNGYNWDMVIVFPKDSPVSHRHQGKTKRDLVVSHLRKAGIETYLYWSAQEDEVICLLRCSVERLKEFADKVDYKMLLDKDNLKKTCNRGLPEFNIGAMNIEHREDITKIFPYEYIYGKFDNAVDIDLYAKPSDLSHPFTTVHRIKLILAIIESRKSLGGAALEWTKLLHEGVMLAFYPLHHADKRDALKHEWVRGGCWFRWPGKQPLDDIKKYFGEKIGFYFAFLGHYTAWLFTLSFIGIVVTVWDASQMTLSSKAAPFFCIFVAFWSVLMLEYWKRKESTLAMRWGMIGFEEEQLDRPEYQGEIITSYIDGSEMLYYPKKKQTRIIAVSQSIITTLIMVVIAAVTTIFIFKNIMKGSSNDFLSTYYSYIAAFLNSAQISIFNVIYSNVSVWLNDKENHRTDTLYEDNLITKTFMFQFVNSYSTFYYTAFFKKYSEGCDYGYMDDYNSCMYDLAISLGIIFGTRVVTSQITGILVPMLKRRKREKAELEGTEGKELTPAEKEYILEPYDKMKGTLNDYAELSIQFGYVTLFVTSFPLAPFLAWLANYIEIGVDGTKLLYHHQRAMPSGNEDIGTWQSIFSILGVIAVMTNAGIVAFTTGIFQERGWSNYDCLWLFVIGQYTIFGFMGLFAYVVEDIPEEVQIQNQRNAFITSKIIDKLPDEESDISSKMDFTPTAASMRQRAEEDKGNKNKKKKWF